MPNADDLVEVTLYCDRCKTQLTVGAPTGEEARIKLCALATEKRWRYVDRLGTDYIPSTPVRPQDLCADCVSQL